MLKSALKLIKLDTVPTHLPGKLIEPMDPIQIGGIAFNSSGLGQPLLSGWLYGGHDAGGNSEYIHISGAIRIANTPDAVLYPIDFRTTDQHMLSNIQRAGQNMTKIHGFTPRSLL